MPSYLIGVLVVLVLIISGCFAPKVIRQEQAFFDEMVVGNESVSEHTLTLDGDHLFYAASGDVQKPALIIIHGTPGNWQQYARFLLNETLLEYFYIVVIDRPGWGKSLLGGGRQVASFSEQATIISALAVRLKGESKGQPVILMGHSLGASIAPKVAMEYPQTVDGLLLLAGTLNPELSEPRWFNYTAEMPGLNFIIGDTMRKSNKEIMVLKAEMTAMAPYWKEVNSKTIVVQGMKDKLVYPDNITFAENQLNAEVTETVRLEQDGHLFPMTRREDVVYWATCLLEQLSKNFFNCEKNRIAIDDEPRKN